MALTPWVALCAFCRTLLSQLLALQSGFLASMLSFFLPPPPMVPWHPTGTKHRYMASCTLTVSTYEDDSMVGPTNHFCRFLPISPLGMILPSWPVCLSLSLQLNKPLGPGIGGLCSQYLCIVSVVSVQPLLPCLSWELLPLRPIPPCASLCMDFLGKILQDRASPGRP
ncbi:hypothetical protein HJG60_009252 [Phyllostomus discolor]|uniref:Secreted protein n=1 Tax=Phyllostomus discolor TaxID=89673 RepID=A0A834DFX0_9CHIR|nr:hypothetical protein HJG60_009252 [Phyllostomus discolor]